MWFELSDLLGEELVTECGLTHVGPRDSEMMQRVLQTLDQLKVHHEIYQSPRVGKFLLAKGEIAVFSKDGGWVRADRALNGIMRLALGHGMQFAERFIADPDHLLSEHDVVICCRGAWTSLPLRVEKRTFAYVRGLHEGSVWIDCEPDYLYGFPSEPDASTFKIGVHQGPDSFDPQSDERSPNIRELQTIREYCRRRFGVSDPEIAEASACLYTVEPNENFIFNWTSEGVLEISACSGHAFKLGPWVGAQAINEIENPGFIQEFPRFSLDYSR